MNTAAAELAFRLSARKAPWIKAVSRRSPADRLPAQIAGEPGEIRTLNQLIKSQLLYR